MLNIISRDRWVSALRDVAAIPFGILVVAWRGISTLSVLYIGAILAITFGVSSLGLAYRRRGIASAHQPASAS